MTVSRMTAAIVVLCQWAELRQVCIAGTGGGVRKLVVLLKKQQTGPE